MTTMPVHTSTRLWPRRGFGGWRVRLSGVVFVLTTGLVLAAAWNTGANLLYLVVGALASLLIISVISVGWQLRGLAMTREAPEAVHRLEPFGVTVRLENHKRWLSAVSIRIESAVNPGQPAGYALKIPPGHAALIRTSQTVPRRGVYQLPPVIAVSGYPFGLIERRRRLTDDTEIVVYPRVWAARTTVLEQLPGAPARAATAAGDGDEFFSLREYVRGDDPRRIAWRVSGRLGKLLVKELARGSKRFVVFVLDTRLWAETAEAWDQFEDVIELLASLSVSLLNQQFSVAVATPAVCLSENRGRAQAMKILELLARVEPTEESYSAQQQGFALARASEARLVFLSPDPSRWGQRSPFGGTRILDPREVIRA